ncbi:hypothetical protein LOK49_LG10G01186 [Camellia lanceoleosa]|uniref:Uncharacterized protein n=1 Tax=Camellia lanceoleosa TaxID=1840588 RepID=A0ACC0G8B4_9ERIC|nr:hypothetical protein LOK49_LG10G01186 [Camellia lanceoleosa]
MEMERLWMELGLVAGILHTRDTTYSRLRDGLSRYFGSAGSNGSQVYSTNVQSFFAALKALSRKESHYGAYATSE